MAQHLDFDVACYVLDLSNSVVEALDRATANAKPWSDQELQRLIELQTEFEEAPAVPGFEAAAFQTALDFVLETPANAWAPFVFTLQATCAERSWQFGKSLIDRQHLNRELRADERAILQAMAELHASPSNPAAQDQIAFRAFKDSTANRTFQRIFARLKRAKYVESNRGIGSWLTALGHEKIGG